MNTKVFTEEDFDVAFWLINQFPLDQILNHECKDITHFVEKQMQENVMFNNQAWEWLRNTYGSLIVDNFNFVIPPWHMSKIVSPNECGLILSLAISTLIISLHKNTQNIWFTMTDSQKNLLLSNLIGQYA